MIINSVSPSWLLYEVVVLFSVWYCIVWPGLTLFLLDWGVDGVPELLIAALDGGGAGDRGAQHPHPLVVAALAQGWAHQPPSSSDPTSHTTRQGPASVGKSPNLPKTGPQRALCGPHTGPLGALTSFASFVHSFLVLKK